MGIFTKIWKPKNRKSIPMYDSVNRVEKDAAGNYWFLSDLFGTRSRWKVYYDMTNNSDKAEALISCTPFLL